MTTKISKEEMKRQQIFKTQDELLKLGKVIAEKEMIKKKEEKRLKKVYDFIFTNLDIPEGNSLEFLKKKK